MNILSDNARLIQRQAAEYAKNPDADVAGMALVSIIAGMINVIVSQCEHNKNSKSNKVTDYDLNYIKDFQKAVKDSKNDDDVQKTIKKFNEDFASNSFLSKDGKEEVKDMLKKSQEIAQEYRDLNAAKNQDKASTAKSPKGG